MDNMQENKIFRTFKSDEDLEVYLRKLVIDIESRFKETVQRVNWLLTQEVEDHTAADTLLEDETGSVHTNKGATGAVTLTLPTVAGEGVLFHFSVLAAQELRIDPGSATIHDSSGQTADKYKYANSIGDCISLVSNEDGDWYVIAKYGTWSEQA